MKAQRLFQLCIVVMIFVIALVLEIIPWPTPLKGLRPAWLVLVLTYWVLAIPNRVNIGSAFLLGLIWDLVLGSVLGVHALVLSVFTYLIAINHLVLRNLSLWMQSLLMITFIILFRFAIFLIEFSLHSISFNWHEIFGAIISGILWPWIFLFLRKIRRQLSLR